MRRLLGLFVVLAAVSAPASAQDRFLEGCVASAEGHDLGGADPAVVCQCAAERAIARGIPAATIDAVVDVDETSGEAVPEVVEAAGALLAESLFACAVDAVPAVEAAPEADVPPGAAVTGAPVPPPPAPPAPPVGIRTGDGTGPVRAEQDGKGGVIRILG